MADFEQISSYLSSVSPGLLTWIVASTILFFLIVIFAFIWRRAVTSKVRSAEGFTGMQFGDVEKMRKSGMISEDEFKAIKRKVAERALAESREKQSGAEAQLILMQAAADPEIVRALLPDDIKEKAKAAQTAAESEFGKKTQAAPAPAIPQPAIRDEEVGDPLARAAPEGPAKPSMNMRRVVAEKEKHAAGEEKGELDLLLEKGAISRDQYDKLKGYFKKS